VRAKEENGEKYLAGQRTKEHKPTPFEAQKGKHRHREADRREENASGGPKARGRSGEGETVKKSTRRLRSASNENKGRTFQHRVTREGESARIL